MLDRKSLAAISFVVLTIVGLLATGASAQLPTGTILGTVKDPSGAVVGGATVTATNTDTGFTRSTTCEADGSYRMPSLPVGNYKVEATHEGFEGSVRTGLTLEVTQEMVVNFSLQVGATTQTVTVTEAAPLVDTTEASIGGTVDEQRVADLPLNGRNWTDLTLMQAGVSKINIYLGTTGQAGSNGTIYSSNGATARSNMYLLDGADERTLVGYNNTSISNTSLGVDGIEEYKVVTLLPDASYGQAMGSQTLLVSKGGTNQFHGDAFDYLRNSSLDGRNYFDALDTANFYGFGTDKSLVYPGKRIPPFRRNDFGGSFGGPIKRDKTFFYGVFEGIEEGTGLTVTKTTMPKACFVNSAGALQSVIPASILNVNSFGTCASGAPAVINVSPQVLAQAAVYPQPNVTGYPTFNYTFPYIQPANEQYGQMRIDQTFSAADSLFFRYTEDDAQEGNLDTFQQFDTNLHSSAKLATLGETHVFSASLLNNFRFSFARNVQILNNAVGTGNLAAAENPAAFAFPSTGLFPSLSPGSGISTTGGNFGPASERQNDYSWSDDVLWTKGKHAFKFGELVNYYQEFYAYQQSPTDPCLFCQGVISFGSLLNFFNADYSSITVTSPGSLVTRDFHENTYGVYAQDDYRPFSRLTLNLGIRYEFSTAPEVTNPALRISWRNPATDTAPTPGNMFTGPYSSLYHFSPRFGFAWDVFGNGKTAVRGGAGIYYDIGNYGVFYSAVVTSTPPIDTSVIITNASAVPAVPYILPFTGTLAGVGSAALPSPRTAPYYLDQPSMLQRNLIIEQQLPWNIGLSVGYVGSQGWNLYQNREGNPTIAVAKDSRGAPVYGCWNTADTTYELPNAAGSCATGFTNFGPRTNKVLGQTDYFQGEGNSYYNALQISVNKRITQGLQFQFNYTWSKLLDDGVGAAFTESVTNQYEIPNGYNTKVDRGPSAYDNASNLRANLIYHAPTIQSDGILSKFANGWWFSAIIAGQSGYPITPALGSDRALQNDESELERPNLDLSFNKAKAVTGNPAQWFNPTMFDVPAAGTLGNAGRGIIRGPGYEDVDFSAVKDTKVHKLGEAGVVEFRAEMFNLMNHPNFALPTATVWSATGAAAAAPAGQIGVGTSGLNAFSTAGQIASTVGTSRQIQFALKLIF